MHLFLPVTVAVSVETTALSRAHWQQLSKPVAALRRFGLIHRLSAYSSSSSSSITLIIIAILLLLLLLLLGFHFRFVCFASAAYYCGGLSVKPEMILPLGRWDGAGEGAGGGGGQVWGGRQVCVGGERLETAGEAESRDCRVQTWL